MKRLFIGTALAAALATTVLTPAAEATAKKCGKPGPISTDGACIEVHGTDRHVDRAVGIIKNPGGRKSGMYVYAIYRGQEEWGKYIPESTMTFNSKGHLVGKLKVNRSFKNNSAFCIKFQARDWQRVCATVYDKP